MAETCSFVGSAVPLERLPPRFAVRPQSAAARGGAMNASTAWPGSRQSSAQAWAAATRFARGRDGLRALGMVPSPPSIGRRETRCPGKRPGEPCVLRQWPLVSCRSRFRILRLVGRLATPSGDGRCLFLIGASIASLMQRDPSRPNDLATELGISPKTLRGWLRRRYPRSATAQGTNWSLTSDQVRAVRDHFGGMRRFARGRPSASPGAAPATTRAPRSRADSDEEYVIARCDQLLGEVGNRQHRFDWLLGDRGRTGGSVRLPVDAYYPRAGIVVEYRETQHHEATPFFDKPELQTVSGVHRGEQRRLYDERREREIPLHGLRLVVVRNDDLACDRRGRLRRLVTNDDLALGKALFP
jgi:hypothetical protein